MIPTTAQTQAMHGIYCRLTKQALRYSTSCHFVWEMWLSRGYTESDLTMVASHIWSKIKSGQRKIEAFRFSRLIGDLDYWEEERALAESARNLAQKVAKQPRTNQGKTQVLRATQRPEQPVDATKHVSVTVAEMVAKWKESMR